MKNHVEAAAFTERPDSGRANGTKSGALAVAGAAGALASACCIGPVVLASVGLVGLAAGIVATFEPMRPIFIAVAFAALGFAWWKIHRRPTTACEASAACSVPQTSRIYKTVFWIVAGIVLALLAFPYYVALF